MYKMQSIAAHLNPLQGSGTREERHSRAYNLLLWFYFNKEEQMTYSITIHYHDGSESIITYTSIKEWKEDYETFMMDSELGRKVWKIESSALP